jgi:excisionase family DNA binding protein
VSATITLPPTASRNPLLGHKLSFKDAALLLGISESALRRIVTNGELAAFRIGRRYLFGEEDLIAFLEGRYGLVRKARKNSRLPPLPAAVLNSPLLKKSA